MSQPKVSLKLADVVRRYDRAEQPVLKGVSFSVMAGESVAITGPSGSGKSTLLNIIGTLDKPDSGSVVIDGTDLATLNDKALAHVRNSKVGFVFQDHHLLPQCTALENVLVPTLAAPPAPDAADRALQLLDAVGLADRADSFPAQLSGGERQRVATVRALIQRPRLLLADEPTGALDHAAADALGDVLIELNQQQQVTLIAVTHWQELASKMGRTLALDSGRLCSAGDES